jgi:hypothetical protein
MTRSPSQAVIEAVERAMLVHAICDCLPDSATPAKLRDHVRFEVARAAEAAALGAIAGDWLIERTYGLSDEGIKGWPEINANAYRCAIEDAQSALRERADELTDETGEQ